MFCYIIYFSHPGVDSQAASIWDALLDEHCSRFRLVGVGSNALVVIIALKSNIVPHLIKKKTCG